MKDKRARKNYAKLEKVGMDINHPRGMGLNVPKKGKKFPRWSLKKAVNRANVVKRKDLPKDYATRRHREWSQEDEELVVKAYNILRSTFVLRVKWAAIIKLCEFEEGRFTGMQVKDHCRWMWEGDR